jgi:cell division septum initiation protein DivIVA
MKVLYKLEKDIAHLKKKVDKLKEEVKQKKLTIKQNSEYWEQKNNSLKSEKEKIMENYKILKNKMISFRNIQREKLKKLVKNSWNCITSLNNYIKLSEKILKLAEICRRLETENEKILPYYENSEINQEELLAELPTPEKIFGIDTVIYDEIESLKNFWKRHNKVMLDMIAIKKQKVIIEQQNDVLKQLLKQYYNGFTLNNNVIASENPLLIVSEFGGPQKSLANTMQEGNFIYNEINKQRNFMK